MERVGEPWYACGALRVPSMCSQKMRFLSEAPEAVMLFARLLGMRAPMISIESSRSAGTCVPLARRHAGAGEARSRPRGGGGSAARVRQGVPGG